jgi:hypothetical protein
MAENLAEPLPVDTEAWEIALKPYATDASAAYDMARRLIEVKQLLQAKPPNVSLAKASLDEACELCFRSPSFVASRMTFTALPLKATPRERKRI